MKLWKLLARWLARKALADEQARLNNLARQLGRELARVPARGTETEFKAALKAVCEETLPVGIAWSLDFRYAEDLAFGQLRIVVEQPSGLGSRRAA